MDPELLKALSAAGMTEEQLRMLAPQLQMGQEMMQPQHAQGREVGAGPFRTFVASSPLEHLANAMREGVGAYITNKVQGRQQDLLTQQRQARQSIYGGLNTALNGGQAGPGPGTPYQQFGTPLDQQAVGQNMAGRPPDPQAAQALMTAMAGSGDQALHAGAQFGLQQQNLQREQSLLQNTIRHQGNLERMEQEKIDQGKYTPIKDWMGNVTGVMETKTGKVLPLSSAAGGGGDASEPGIPTGQNQAKFLKQLGLNQGAIDKMAEVVAVTGQPPMGKWGKASPMVNGIVMSRADELYPDAHLATNRAEYVSNTKSLVKQQGLEDLTKSWEGTGKANLGVLRQLSKEMVNSGSPLVNKPLRWIFDNVAGDPTITKFKAAHAAVVNEYAKILSGNLGSGGTTEGARHEAEGMIPMSSTPAQVNAAGDVLETDAGNRLASMGKQIAETRARLGGKSTATAPEAPPPPPPAKVPTYNPATGKVE